MALLGKFIKHNNGSNGHPLVSSSDDPLIASIISNLQTVLQSRRTAANGQKIGINDYSEQLLGDPLMHRLCADFASQIDFHEPRLSQVTVKLVKSTDYLWQMEVKACLRRSQPICLPRKEVLQQVCFILELVKPAYINRLFDVSVVVL
jgi:predicted component of type VI protein secretion system